MKIEFVTGKGGVGKSAVAAALALAYSSQGRRTLLLELGHQSFYKEYLGLTNVQFSPLQIRNSLSIARWTGEDCLNEYAHHLIPVAALADLFIQNSVSKTFINIAPAVKELALLGKITSQERKVGPPMNFDVLVVDSYSTGHFMSLLKAPLGMMNAVKLGPMADQSKTILDTLKKEDLCRYHLVSLCEELPLEETLEFKKDLESFLNIKPEIILNKMVPFVEVQATNDDKPMIFQFRNYLDKLYKKQVRSVRALGDGTTQRLPLVFNEDPWGIVENLAEVITNGL